MKRIISLLLAVMTVFTLAACGTKDTTVNAQGLAALEEYAGLI